MSTVQISAADVNKLRQQTGAGMMDCKKALTETNGDFEAAIDFLRKKGAKVAASRQDRESNEGVVIARTSDDYKLGVIIELNCETDFVAKNAEFVAFANAIANVAVQTKPASIEELYAQNIDLNEGSGTVKIGDAIINQTGKIGEKIGVSKYEVIEGEKVVAYIHGNFRLGVLVGLSKAADGADEDRAGLDGARFRGAHRLWRVACADAGRDLVRGVFSSAQPTCPAGGVCVRRRGPARRLRTRHGRWRPAGADGLPGHGPVVA